MAAWRYEISLLVLKIYFTRSLRSFRISARPFNILYLSFTCEDIGVAMVTNIIFLFFLRNLTFWNRKYSIIVFISAL